MEFTKEEINLCKLIAKKHRKKIVEADWLFLARYKKDDEVGFVQEIKIDSVFNEWLVIFLIASEEVLVSGCIRQDNPDVIPLWTISDCLEFLRNNVNQVDVGCVKNEMPYCYIYDGLRGIEERYRGKTLLEACLKPVLAVLEETK